MTTGRVSLRAVADVLGQLTEDRGAFLNPATGEIVILTNDELYAVEREEESASLEILPERLAAARAVIASEEFTFLPTCFDINEQEMRGEFCSSVASEALRRPLLEALAEREAAERFAAAVRSAGLEADWRAFRSRALEALAATWLEKNGIAFRRE